MGSCCKGSTSKDFMSALRSTHAVNLFLINISHEFTTPFEDSMCAGSTKVSVYADDDDVMFETQ